MIPLMMLSVCCALLLLARGAWRGSRRRLRRLGEGSGPGWEEAGFPTGGQSPSAAGPLPGCGLGAAGRRPARWGRGETGAATGRGLPTPVRLELIAAMLGSGLSISRAVHTMARVEGSARLSGVARLLEAGVDWDAAWDASRHRHPSSRGLGVKARGTPATPSDGEVRELHHLRESLEFAVRTGAPAASLLRAQAGRLRRQRHREAEKRAAALGVRLMLPLGLCSLPAFICLGVVPVLIGLVPTLW